MDLSRATWRKSSRSQGNGGECVEVASMQRIVAVRDSKSVPGPNLVFGSRAWGSFMQNCKAGELDLR